MGRNKKESHLPTSVFHENRDITDPDIIANMYNDYFINIGKNLATNLNGNISYKNYLKMPSKTTCHLERVTTSDVENIIDKLKNKSSSGYDGISNTILKSIKSVIINPLTLIINQMVETGIFPDVLKISKVIPIYKKGDVSLLSNYRPISLLPTLSKIFERVIYNQLYNYFVDNSLLTEYQFGFRVKHSTELATIRLLDYINKEMDKKHTPVNIYLDLSKAFDTINFEVLLYKMIYYGVVGTPFKLIQNYLINRKQYVKYKTYESNLKSVNTGVPQGSILGPLLLSIYINDLVTVSNKLNYIMYADDTTLYFNVEDFPKDDLCNCVTNELNKIHLWLQNNKLSLNAEKTTCMTFHTRQKHINPILYSINGVEIENVDSFKFLGIFINNHLTWSTHIGMVANKLSKILGILKRLRYVYPEQVLLQIYNSLFMAHINYGLLVWGVDTDRIFKLQKKAVRIITGNDYIAHSEPIFKSLELLKIVDIYKLKILRFYYNLTHYCLPVYFNNYLDVINNELPHSYQLRINARPLIRLPKIRHQFAEFGLQYQLVNLLNNTHEHYPEILAKIDLKNHSMSAIGVYIANIYLNTYKFECDLRFCYECGRSRFKT